MQQDNSPVSEPRASEPAPGSPPMSVWKEPTWKEVTEFIDRQNDKARNSIMHFLTIAFLVGGSIAGFVGWKTIDTAKANAQAAAQDAAKAKVKELLQDDERVQKLVLDAATDLFAKGAFREAIDRQVNAKLPAVIAGQIDKQLPPALTGELARRDLLPRAIPATVEKMFESRMRKYAGKKVLILFLSEPEPKAFAESLEHSLKALGMSATKQEWGPAVNLDIAEDEALNTLVSDLIAQSVGRHPVTLTIKNPRDTVARQSATSGSFQGFPDADVYVEVGVRQAKREQ